MVFEKYKLDDGTKLSDDPEFQELISELKWAMDRTWTHANHKQNAGGLTRVENAREKYKLNEVKDGK